MQSSSNLVLAYVIACAVQSILFIATNYNSVSSGLLTKSDRMKLDISVLISLCFYSLLIPIDYYSLPLWTRYLSTLVVLIATTVGTLICGRWMISTIAKSSISIAKVDAVSCRRIIQIVAVLLRLWCAVAMGISTNGVTLFELSAAQLVATNSIYILFALAVIVLPGRFAISKYFDTLEQLRMKQVIVRYASHEIRSGLQCITH